MDQMGLNWAKLHFNYSLTSKLRIHCSLGRILRLRSQDSRMNWAEVALFPIKRLFTENRTKNLRIYSLPTTYPFTSIISKQRFFDNDRAKCAESTQSVSIGGVPTTPGARVGKTTARATPAGNKRLIDLYGTIPCVRPVYLSTQIPTL